ncbi:MAG: Phosphopantetheine-binding protein [Acidobacteria bacterium]|nr:Phosphopantetheine-binding protein [Acidobacteriota bacterium]
MTRAELQKKLIEIVRKEKDLPDDKLTPETELAEAGIDSLDALTILFAIEEELKINIPDTAARAMKTFGDIVDAAAVELQIGGEAELKVDH